MTESTGLRVVGLIVVLFAGCDPKPPAAIQREPSKASHVERSFFRDATDEVGLRFLHSGDGADQFFFPAIMSGGLAVFDMDNDGDLDVLLLNSRVPHELRSPSARPNEDESAFSHGLFRQEPDHRFTNVTAGSGLDGAFYAMGAAVGDIDNDGLPDLYLTAYGPDRLYRNEGNGKFHDISAEAGISSERWSTSAAFIDYDRDGWLDLFVANYVDYDPGHPCIDNGGGRDFCNPAVFGRTSDQLFRNRTGETKAASAANSADRKVRFTDESVSTGIASKRGAGLGVLCADFNNDGWQDIYVANDGHANFLWINGQNGTFRDEAILQGVAYDAVGRGQGSMGLAAGDIDRDGRLDLFVTNLDGEPNALYCGRGDDFSEQSSKSGMATTSFPFTGFGTAMFDLENDGDLDIAVTNGRVRRLGRSEKLEATPNGIDASDSNDRRQFLAVYREASSLFLNQGKAVFQAVDSKSDSFAGLSGVGRGLAAADLDNDGDVDLVVTYLDQSVRYFRNESAKPGHWLNVKLLEPSLGGRNAIGASVEVVAGGERFRQWYTGGTSYLTANDSPLHVGLGQFDRCDSLTVTWPNGDKEVFDGGAADKLLTLRHGEGKVDR